MKAKSDKQLYRWINAYNEFTSPPTLRTDRGHKLAKKGVSIVLSNLRRHFSGMWKESESGRLVINNQ